MFDIQKMMKQAQKMQEQMQQAQSELEATDFEGTAGGGAVIVVCTGKRDFKSVKIRPDVTDDPAMLEDLVLAALNDVHEKVTKTTEEKMKAITGGMNIPGLKLPL